MLKVSSSRLSGIWRFGIWSLLALAAATPALAATDTEPIRIGEYGAFTGKEAAFPFLPDEVPADALVAGVIDHYLARGTARDGITRTTAS